MPIGFYTKETIRPFYTTDQYLESDQGKREMESLYTMENRIKGLIAYPGKIARRVWYRILVWSGYLKDLK